MVQFRRFFPFIAFALIIIFIIGFLANMLVFSEPPYNTQSPRVPTNRLSTKTPDMVQARPSGGSTPSVLPSQTSVPLINAPAQTSTSFVLYKDGRLADGWQNASWSTKIELQSTVVQRDGKPTIEVIYENSWGGFGVADWNMRNSVDTNNYSHLRFWVHGGQVGGQAIGVMLYRNEKAGERVPIEQYISGGRIAANTWQEVIIPLSVLGFIGETVTRIDFQDITGKAQPAYYLGGIEFFKEIRSQSADNTVRAQISVDINSNRQPISPLIYGMSLAPDDVLKDTNIALNRMGGNPYSRYNWVLGNAVNAGSDWEFRNYAWYPDKIPGIIQPSGWPDLFHRENRSAGAETLLTVPMLGYVAKDRDTETRSINVPKSGGSPVSPGSEAIAGYDPRQNQETTSVKSYARKNGSFQDPPDQNTDVVYQDEWIYHLTRTFGKAAEGGVRFYAMDNEPDLWADNTHVDVQPVQLSYDELLKRFLEYASAVKAVDPTAQVTGPVISGWLSAFYSAADRSSDNFRTAADRKVHGNKPLLPWFLEQVRKYDEANGQRTLDVLDIHYYPAGQGIFESGTPTEGKTDAKTSALRLRATRSLWDPTYTDESWINQTEQPKMQFIRQLRKWIDQYYPGTKIGITEWNFGADKTMNGALAIADVLGIYGRESVYLANYWTFPKLGSPGQQAFKLYRNYDGQKSTFGDVSVQAQSSIQNQLAVYASEDTQSKQLKLMVINKSDKDQMAGQINLQGGTFRGAVKVYQISDATNLRIQALPDSQINGSSFEYMFAPYSITLMVIDRAQ